MLSKPPIHAICGGTGKATLIVNTKHHGAKKPILSAN
jgi:hypothetical protein